MIEPIIEHSGAPYRYVVTPNAYHVVTAHDEPERLLPIYRAAWLSLCDSRIVRALARLDRRAAAARHRQRPGRGAARRARRAISDHTPQRILVVGPPRDAEAALRAAYPNLDFEIMPAPGALAQSAELRLAVARACINRRWDIALLCVGCPAQELIARQLAELGCKSGIALCVGASIDFLTGAARPRAAVAAEAQSRMGLSTGAGAAAACGADISSSRRKYCASLWRRGRRADADVR